METPADLGPAAGGDSDGPNLGVEVHDDKELGPSVSGAPLLGAEEAGHVGVLLQQRQAVDGALVGEGLPIGRTEELDSDAAVAQEPAEHCAVAASTNQLPGHTTRGHGSNIL